MANKGLIKAILNASFLVVLTFALFFLYFNAQAIYGQDYGRYQTILIGYLVFFSSVLTLGLVTAPEVVKGLAKASYWKSFGMKFIPSAVLTFTILILFQGMLKGLNTINPLKTILYVPLATLLFHIIVISQTEEIGFRGVLYESLLKKTTARNALIISTGAFSLFHFAVSGGSFLVMATYIPLSLFWTTLKLNGYPWASRIPFLGKFLGPTRYTQQSNAGSHFAWNMFIVGVKPFGG